MASGREASDPLAELARLVGQDDPYRNVFRPVPAAPAPAAHEQEWHEDPAGAADHRTPAHDADQHHDDAGAEHWHPDAAGAAHGGYYEGAETPEHGWAEHDDAYARQHDEADDERYYAIDAASHRDDAGIAETRAAVDGAEASIPDLWARGGAAAGYGAAPEIDPSHGRDHERTRGGGSARRPLLVLAAVLLLTGGGLGASFLAKGGAGKSTIVTNGSGAPTILAASGPTKIKQDDPSAIAPEDQDAALLNKGAGPAAGPVKVVQNEEQPADLSQLPKADDGVAPAQAQTQSAFPEAKKVKTFVVHPDGTPIYDDGQAAGDAGAAATGTLASAAAPLPSTPKATGKGVATPSSPPTIASLVTDPPPPADAAPAPTTAKPAKPKPAQSAGTAANGFGLQLAASPSEAEAHAAFAKLKKKYPAELGALSANVHQSETGGKPVYRVRIGGMTREDASALCSKLMAGGGSCFVVHD